MNTIVILVIIKYLLACEVLMKSDTKKNLRAEISADISYNSCRWYIWLTVNTALINYIN